MSYPRPLEEIPEEELRAEIERRECLQKMGLCDYCGKNPSQPECRMVERHIYAHPNIKAVKL